MAQDYTMTAAGLSPATSPEYRAAFTRASRLFALSQRRPAGSCTQGAATILSENIETENGRSLYVIHYRGADGEIGTVRLFVPSGSEYERDRFFERKSEYLKRLTGGSGTIDTRSVAQALRDEAADIPKTRRPRAKTAAGPTEAPPTAVPSAELDALRAALARVTEERDELRAEVARLTVELTDARTAADTDEADLARAAETIADLRAEVTGLRAMRLTLRIGVPPPVVRA